MVENKKLTGNVKLVLRDFLYLDDKDEILDSNYGTIQEMLSDEGIDLLNEPSASSSNAPHRQNNYGTALGQACERNFPKGAKPKLTDAVGEAVEQGAGDQQIIDEVKRILKMKHEKLRVVVTKDYRVMLEKKDGKRIEVNLPDAPKAFYLFFLKHKEGVDRYDFARYMPELVFIYVTIRKIKNRDPFEVINNMVGRQMPNNLNAVRDAIRAALEDERKDLSVEQKDKSGVYLITLPEKDRLLNCPNIAVKKIAQLPPMCSDSIKETKKILREANVAI